MRTDLLTAAIMKLIGVGVADEEASSDFRNTAIDRHFRISEKMGVET